MDTDTELRANKHLIRKFIEEIFVRRDPAAIDGLVSDDFESHTWPSNGDGKASLREATTRMSTALDDVSFSVEDLIAEGDRVVARVKASATPVGKFMGMPPSGRSYEVDEMHIFRLAADGKVAEHWHQMDTMSLMKQLKGDGQDG
jgi:steroid delta-isomerase-like uncharacterized protein